MIECTSVDTKNWYSSRLKHVQDKCRKGQTQDQQKMECLQWSWLKALRAPHLCNVISAVIGRAGPRCCRRSSTNCRGRHLHMQGAGNMSWHTWHSTLNIIFYSPHTYCCDRTLVSSEPQRRWRGEEGLHAYHTEANQETPHDSLHCCCCVCSVRLSFSAL